ncbi:MAG: hypothetical protein P8Y80_12395 [Acidobacteriota bacterium]|jgi:hypothetical protein
MMNYAGLSKISLRVFLGFLGLTALIAIVTVLSGEFGELQMKVLVTTFTISAASICAMSCAAFIVKKNRLAIGLGGIFLTVITAVLVICGIWPEIDSEIYWKTTGTIGVTAIACAHGFLLYLPNLGKRYRWVQNISFLSIVVLALQIIVAMWGEIPDEAYYRFLTVVAIMVGLETLSIPILFRMGKGQKRELLILEKLEDGTYRDTGGKRYQVNSLE